MTTLKKSSLDFYRKYYKLNNNYSSSELTSSFSFYTIVSQNLYLLNPFLSNIPFSFFQ